MGPNTLFARAFALACAATMCGCGGGGSPLSPSSLTPLMASDSSLTVRPLDYHEPTPVPIPVPTPDPAPAPTPDPAPMPTALTISIVGSFGSGAFMPNPIQAAVGDMIVWTNNDRTLHQIVLDDGTMIGDIAPGASSAPMPLTSATAAYRCTIHPSMVGSINGAAATEPTPPAYEPPPMDDPYYD